MNNPGTNIRFFRPGDIFVFLLIIFIPLYWLSNRPQLTSPAPIACVEIQGHLKYELPLNQRRLFYLNEWNPPVVLEIRPGKIRILHNDCAKQICVHTGFIDQPYQSIVCVPKKIVIYLKHASMDSIHSAPHVITG